MADRRYNMTLLGAHVYPLPAVVLCFGSSASWILVEMLLRDLAAAGALLLSLGVALGALRDEEREPSHASGRSSPDSDAVPGFDQAYGPNALPFPAISPPSQTSRVQSPHTLDDAGLVPESQTPRSRSILALPQSVVLSPARRVRFARTDRPITLPGKNFIEPDFVHAIGGPHHLSAGAPWHRVWHVFRKYHEQMPMPLPPALNAGVKKPKGQSKPDTSAERLEAETEPCVCPPLTHLPYSMTVACSTRSTSTAYLIFADIPVHTGRNGRLHHARAQSRANRPMRRAQGAGREALYLSNHERLAVHERATE